MQQMQPRNLGGPKPAAREGHFNPLAPSAAEPFGSLGRQAHRKLFPSYGGVGNARRGQRTPPSTVPGLSATEETLWGVLGNDWSWHQASLPRGNAVGAALGVPPSPHFIHQQLPRLLGSSHKTPFAWHLFLTKEQTLLTAGWGLNNTSPALSITRGAALLMGLQLICF